MQSFRIDFNDCFYAFHGFSSQSCILLVADAQHDVFESVKQISYFCLYIQELNDISDILYVDQVSSGYPSFCLFFIKSIAPNLVKFIL